LTSVSIRNNSVPKDIILTHTNAAAASGDYAVVCIVDKHLKNIPTAVTAPGTCVGSNTHTHTATGNHGHGTSATTSHAHSFTTSAVGNQWYWLGSSTWNNNTAGSHTHTFAACNSSPSLTVDSSTGAHDHGSLSHEQSYKKLKLAKKTSTVYGLRRKSVDRYQGFAWVKPVADLPSTYSFNSSYFGLYPKVDTANIGCTGGLDTHQHVANATHAHSITVATHTHTLACTSSTQPPAGEQGGSSSSSANVAHSHQKSTFAAACSSGTGCSASNCTHQHSNENSEYLHHTAGFVTVTSIGMRRSGLIKDTVVFWEDPLASIPTGFQVADGTNCTTSLLDRYLKGIANACTNPASGGSATHTHSSVDFDHSHANTAIGHVHNTTGTTGTPSGTSPAHQSGTIKTISATHTHTGGVCSSNSNVCVTLNALGTDTHTHGSSDNKPVSVEMVFLQKL
jgi:hypothetical protein